MFAAVPASAACRCERRATPFRQDFAQIASVVTAIGGARGRFLKLHIRHFAGLERLPQIRKHRAAKA